MHFKKITLVLVCAACIAAPLATAEGQIPNQPIPMITAWLHKYDWQAAVQSVAANGDLIHEVSPAWYRPKKDGGVHALAGAPVNDPSLLATVRAKGIIVRPLVMNTNDKNRFDPSLAVFGQKCITAITALATENRYDGITLDYENLRPDELPQLASFVTALAASLHKNGKTLAVTMEWKFAGQAPDAWRQIGTAADAVEFMGYPEHDPSTEPGPIASLSLLQSRLKTVLASVPASKLTLGMALYAVSWQPQGNKTGTWTALVQPALAQGALVGRDSKNGTPYLKNGISTIWYEDAQSIQKKVQTGMALGITHFAFWRLGGEDPRIWIGLRNSRKIS